MTLEKAADLTRTGDVWLFRGRGGADRAIQTLTKAPVNHVGVVWSRKYGPRAWLRRLSPAVTTAMADAVPESVARLDGTPFPTTGKLAGRWFGGRLPTQRLRRR